MKYPILIITFFLFLGITTTTFAQQNDSTTIKITLPSTEKWTVEKVFISYSNPALVNLRNTLLFKQKDTKNNEWTTTIALSKTQQWTVSIGNKWTFDLLLFPNDEVEIKLDEEGAAKFLKGKTSKENEITYDWSPNFFNTMQEFGVSEPKEAIQKMDSLTNAYLLNYEKAFVKSKPNSIFDTYFRTELKLAQITAYNQYPLLRSRHLDEKDMSKILTEEYKKSIPVFKTDLNADYPYTTSYLNYISYNSLGEECVHEEGNNRTEFIKCQYEGLQKLTSKNEELQKILSFASANNAIQSIKLAGVIGIDKEEEKKIAAFLDEFLEKLNKKYPNTEEVAFLEKQIELTKKMTSGNPAPSFSLKNKDGKTVSLADLKGKYVMIDFWATWCQPCLAEVPHSIKLEEEFGKDVTFVYVCMSSKEDKWKEMVAEKPAQQVQLFIEGDAQKQMQEDYQVSFYPTYILLDREGKIITKNIRPSQNGREVLKEIIEAEK